MKNTLAALDYLHQLIDEFRAAFDENNRSLIGEPLKFFRLISDELEQNKENGLLSEDMVQSYTDVLQEMMDNNGDYSDNTEQRFNKLSEINNIQTEDCVAADKKTSEVFDVKWKDNNSQVKDTKKDLQHISDLMRFYENSYEQDGALKSLDLFCEIASGIKKAVENKTISEKTANELFKPLENIRKKYFDNATQKNEMAQFNSVLRGRLSDANEKDSQRGILDTMVDGISSMRPKKEDQRNMQQVDVAKTQGEIDKALEEQRLADQEKSGNGNESQEKALREQKEKNEADKTKSLPQESMTKEQVIEQIRQSVEKYGNIYKEKGSILEPEVGEAWDEMTRVMSDAIKNKVVSDDVAKQIMDTHENMRRLLLMSSVQLDGVENFKKILGEHSDVRKEIVPEKKEVPQEQQTLFHSEVHKQGVQKESTETKPLTMEQKMRPQSRSELEDMGRARIEAFKEKYDLSIAGRKLYNEKQWNQILDQELGFTDIEDTYKNDFIKGMLEYYWKDPEIREGVRAEIPKPTIKAQTVITEEKPGPKQPEQKTEDRPSFWNELQAINSRHSDDKKESQTPQDKIQSFRAGIEKTKQLSKNRQQQMMDYFMKKRKMEWDDH